MSNRINRLPDITAQIVAAYLDKNPVLAADLPKLIDSVSAAVAKLGRAEIMARRLSPAVHPEKSVHRNYIVCLDDGKRFKSLKWHLSASHHLTPDEYRAKWGLPADYPMVAPNYAIFRSALAKGMGLGRNIRKVRRTKRSPGHA